MRKSGKARSGLMLALIGSLSACGGGSGSSEQASGGEGSKLAPEVWTKCADEYQTCTFSGTREVRYGLNGTWVKRTATGSIACSNEVFGDPLPGADKVCEYVTITSSPSPSPAPAPAPSPSPTPTPAPSWIKCADEYGTCTVPGTTEVRYGLNGTWATRTVTGSVACSNEVFGDPLPGANKICEYATTTPSPTPTPTPTPAPTPTPTPTPTPAPGPAPSWTKCADEYGTCTVPGTTQVRYGLNGTWATRTVTGSVACSNEVFGDPLPGANKICEYATTTPAPGPAPTLPAPVPGATLTMSCVDGSGWQCSGDAILRIENGVTLTASGVQAYGKSTNDLANPIVDRATAYGLAPASGGYAEVRVAKAADGTISTPALLLRNLDIRWDGKVERPIIVETFRTAQGRVTIDSNGLISFGALPHRSNLGFYDFATKGPAGTQLNYANNSYFPRTDPSRCGFSPCPTTETAGIQYQPGDWLSGGGIPHSASVSRLHGDGDVHAGDGPPDSNGNPTILPGGDGPGVPFPGSKGYRFFNNWSYQYANLGAWASQDTVQIVEWTAGAGTDEHNQSRSGMVAFGNVTAPAQVPSSGSASYAVQVYGWYAPNGTAEASFYRGIGQVTVNFATRQATIVIQNTRTDNEAQTPVPATMNTTAMMGAAGSNVANYLTGTVNNGTLGGGVSARYFGPVTGSGSGAGPAEIGGAFTMSGSGGATIVGGFLGRRQ